MGRNPPMLLPTISAPAMPPLPRLPYRRTSKKQSTPAALLCPEILLVVFEHLRDDSGPYLTQTGLASAPRVCRTWSNAATVTMYERIELVDPRAIRLLVRTLRTTSLGGLVTSIHLYANFRQNSKHVLAKWKWPGVDGVLDILLAHCPHLYDLALDIEQLRPKPLGSLRVRDSLERLRFLRVPAAYAPLVTAVSGGSVDLPNLEELSLSGWAVWQDKWTSLPRLRRLILDRTNLSGAPLLALVTAVAPTLTHLEFRGLCTVAMAHLPEIIALLGPTLESLALLDNCFCVLSQMMDELKQLGALHTLQIDCVNTIAPDFFLHLPPALRAVHLVSSVGYGRSLTLDAALSLFMCNPGTRYPLLKALYVVGDTSEWGPWQHTFLHQRCQAHGLQLTLQCWEVPSYPAPEAKSPGAIQQVAHATVRRARTFVERFCRTRY